ncbi:uncharacterized protein LOC105687189 [Athalia rosae]|uniref:uncharacterized protein LOC105687189 n=1 Tax=Athalia rosae TaxID=37344 RepID=UPI002034A248|nr:uncharacterized protein LOC105687189 [Athalia rosae]
MCLLYFTVRCWPLTLMIIASLTIIWLTLVTGQALGGCECDNYDCGCCEHIQEKYVHLNNTVCTNISYLPADIGFMMTITFDSYAVFNTTVSARNPPPICIGQDYIKELEADICIRFYDLDVNKHHFHGCVKFDIEVFKIKTASYDLGCFDMGPKNAESRLTKLWHNLWPQNNEVQVILV